MKAVYLLLVILIFISEMVQCSPLPECEDRNWYCRSLYRARKCQKKNECFPTTLFVLEVRKKLVTPPMSYRNGPLPWHVSY